MHSRKVAVRPLLACLLVLSLPQLAPATEKDAATDSPEPVAEAPAELPLAALVRAALSARSKLVRSALDPDSKLLQEMVAQEREQQQQERPKHELSLLDAVEMALRNNLTVRVNRFNQDVQFESIMANRAQFDPQIQFDAPQSFSRRTTPQSTQLGGASVLSTETFQGGFSFNETLEWGTRWNASWNAQRRLTNATFSTRNPTFTSNLNFSVTQPLLRNFGRVNRTGILVAQNNFSVSREQFREQVQTTILQAYQAYWNLVGAIDTLQVRQEALDLAEQQLRRNRIQVEIGTLAPIETVQAEQSAENARFQLIQAQNALEDAQDNLKQFLNIEEAIPGGRDLELVPTDEPESTAEPIDVEAAIATALGNDPQLRQQRITRDSRRLQLKQARNALLPNVDFTGTLGFTGLGGPQLIRGGGLGSGQTAEILPGGFSDALSQLFSGEFNNWSVGLTVTLPMHNYQARAQHAQASINERQTLAQLADREQQVMYAVRRAARAVESGARQVAAAQVATELSERQLQAEQRKFEVGTSTNFNVLNFQDQLSNARLSELQALIAFNNARAQLEQAKGTLLKSLGVSVQEAGRGPRR
ncbi:MAG: TolC family protein [Acidobacteriota bacterium]